MIEYLNKIGKDKYMHASLGAVLAFVTFVIPSIWMSEIDSLAVSFCITSLAFIYKEATDPKFCWKDIAAGYSLAIPTWIAYLM